MKMKESYYKLFKQKDFSLLFSGRFFTMCGYIFFGTELIWMTMKITNNSATYLSLMAIAETLPFLVLGIYGGIKADTWNRKRMIIYSDLVKLPLIFITPILYLNNILNFWILLIIAILVSSLDCFSEPAFRSILPDLVRKKQLKSANALLDTIQRGTSIVVPMTFAIFLKLFSEIHLFTLAGICYSIAVFSHILLQYTHKKVISTHKNSNTLYHLKETFSFLKVNKVVLLPILGSSLAILINTGIWRIGLPILLKEEFKVDISIYGIIMGIVGGVSLVTSFSLGLIENYKNYIIFTLGLFFWGLGLSIIGFAPHTNLLFIYFAAASIGIGQAAQGLTRLLIIQENVPSEKLGTIYSTSSTMNYVSDTVSMAVISPIISFIGIFSIFSTGGIGLMLFAVFGLIFYKKGMTKGDFLIKSKQFLQKG
ncbi:MFS transporter [Mesobacillus thioparans]|uniref:MFS transporter n=1 Tax=Mesobacillus thioparans TaxID=370439 RepID=UPI0039F0919A